jgi:hypothetical protein
MPLTQDDCHCDSRKLIVILSDRRESKDLRLLFVWLGTLFVSGHGFSRAAKPPKE